MRFNTVVEKNYDSLKMLIDEATAFDQEHVLNGLEARHYNVDEIEMLEAHVREHRGMLEKEIASLKKFAVDFNRQYATNNNQCFDTARQLFYRIRSGVAETKKLYKRFCSIRRGRGPLREGVEQRPSVFRHSMLATSLQSPRIFGLEGYDESVGRLCQEMEQFFTRLLCGLMLCRDVLQREAIIRHDFTLAKDIYDTCCQKEVSHSRGMMAILAQVKPDNDDLTLRKIRARSIQDFVCQGFHTVDRDCFQRHALIQVINEGQRNGLTEMESLLWNNNQPFVMKVRAAMAHFDALSPKGYKDGSTGRHKLSAKYVAMFMQWCNITGSGKEKQFVEDYFNKEYRGKYQCISSTSVNTAKTKYTKMEYQHFCSHLAEAIGETTNEEQRQAM